MPNEKLEKLKHEQYGTDFTTFYGSTAPTLKTGDEATWLASATDSSWKIEENT